MQVLKSDTVQQRLQLWLPVVLMFVLHFALWGWMVATTDTDWLSLLRQWDAEFYRLIVENGYEGHSWAFLPLYPLASKGFALLTGLSAHSQVAGTLLSSLLFLVWVGCVGGLSERASEPSTLAYLTPQTWIGWFCAVWSPASYVFHSHHTEALFLLLSFLAFWLAARDRTWIAAILAGLCFTARNQGVFVIFSVAVLSASLAKSLPEKVRRFCLSGLIGALFLLSWLCYQYWQTGNPFFSFQVQKNWAHATSLWSVLQTFWFGNPWQNTNLGSILHHVVFGLLILAALWLWRKSRIFALYIALSLTVMPLQGELVNSFRFGAVLFPAWFVLGDRLARCPPWMKLGVLACLVFLNFMVTRNYALGRWAY